MVLPALAMLGLFGRAAPEQPQDPRFRVVAETIRVPVVVIGEDGRLYTDLRRENFTVLEDGVAQEVTSFDAGESPLTLVMLLEYSRVVQYIRGEVIRPAGVFASQVMQPGDYVALVAFDLRPAVLADFTDVRYQLLEAIGVLMRGMPAFSESNLFDALNFVLKGGTLENFEYKGLAEVEGRTGVLLVATGIDTFSRIRLDEALVLAANSGVPVYSIGIGELAYIRAEPYLTGLQRLTFLQAQNTLRSLSRHSGGRFYSVRFPGALGGVLDSVGAMLRFQYTLGYISSNPRREGKRRSIEVLVDVAGDGRPDNDRLEVQHRQYYFEPTGSQ